MRSIIHRYYTVELPTDLTDGMAEGDIVDLAILQIKEKQRFYRTPAEWKGMWVRGSQVRVRYSYRQEVVSHGEME